MHGGNPRVWERDVMHLSVYSDFSVQFSHTMLCWPTVSSTNPQLSVCLSMTEAFFHLFLSVIICWGKTLQFVVPKLEIYSI